MMDVQYIKRNIIYYTQIENRTGDGSATGRVIRRAQSSTMDAAVGRAKSSATCRCGFGNEESRRAGESSNEE